MIDDASTDDASMRDTRIVRRGWPWAKRVLAWLFIAAIAWLIVRHARTIDWSDVLDALRTLPAGSIALALLLVATSHLLYSTFDLVGRSITGHRLRVTSVMGVTAICYAFNLNLGSIVGSVALRYRLYSRLGLDAITVTRVMVMSMLTNWLGYFVLAGTLFSIGQVHGPAEWSIDDVGLRLAGAALLVVVLGYLVICAICGGRTWTVRGQAIEAPTLSTAVLQVAMGAVNWALMAGVLWILMMQAAPYPQVLAILLVAVIAVFVTQVPAGLGVIEAVFIALLGDVVPPSRLVAALLAYRASYYLLPLAVASMFYVVAETRTRKPAAPI